MGGGVTIRYREKYEKGLDITGPFYYFPTKTKPGRYSCQAL
jgi:hypothetical protein